MISCFAQVCNKNKSLVSRLYNFLECDKNLGVGLFMSSKRSSNRKDVDTAYLLEHFTLCAREVKILEEDFELNSSSYYIYKYPQN